MMNLSQWFHDQLQASADGFVWSVQQVPLARRHIQPPYGFGEWTVARQIFHMVFYEQNIALPSMQQWLGKPRQSLKGLSEEIAWRKGRGDVENLLTEFKIVRAEQVKLLPKFDEQAWNTTYETIWGPVTLVWVVSKTYQHTAEHTNNVMQMALFWDRVLAW